MLEAWVSQTDPENVGRSVVRGGWSMASRDVEIPAVTYLVYLV